MKMRRFEMDLSEEMDAAISQAMRDCGLHTRKELFNTALTLLKWAVGEWQAGREVVALDDKRRVIKELKMPGLDIHGRVLDIRGRGR